MTEPIADPVIYPLAAALAVCMCTELAKTIGGPVCCCAVVHSAQAPILDGCDCSCDNGGKGRGWVRVVTVGPNPAPLSRPGAGAACAPGLVVTLEMGTARCYPLTDEGTPLPCEDQAAAARLQMSDMWALRKTFKCCTALADVTKEWVTWNPAGPSGGCAGGYAQIRVTLARG